MRTDIGRRTALGALAAGAMVRSAAAEAEPIRIGFAEAMTGSLAAIGKSGIVATQIWAEAINAKGGLLGRQVKLIFYDNQSNPAKVPGLYVKLLDVDKVDIVMSGYATNMAVPAMPVVISHNKLYMSLFSLATNSEFHYDRTFAMIATGPDPKKAFSQGFFEIAAAMKPRPTTLAIVGADAEFPRNALDGARALAKEQGLKIVYDKTYPPTTSDFSPIIRAIQATSPDMVLVASYPPDSVGMIRAANEVGLKTKLFGGGMVGLQSTPIKVQLGPLLNGIVNYDFWLPWTKLATPEGLAFLKKYQAEAPGMGVDVLGYYLPPFGYAYMQVLQQAIEATKSLDDNKLAEALRTGTFKTIVGDIKFGANGEWLEPRVMEVQFQNVKANDMEQFRDPGTEVVLWPPALKTGDIQFPYTDVKR